MDGLSASAVGAGAFGNDETGVVCANGAPCAGLGFYISSHTGNLVTTS